MESNNQLIESFSRYLRNESSPDEVRQLLRHFKTGDHEEELRDLVIAELNKHKASTETSEEREMYHRIFNRVSAEIEENADIKVSPIKRSRARWISTAAIILITCSIGFYYFDTQKAETRPKVVLKSSPPKNDIEPGTNKATLTLADGRVIDLNNITNGEIAMQNDTRIKKTIDGEIVYTPIELNSLVPVYNTINTPRGGEFKITLPDGTRVWLNASSSLKFPTAFTGHERNVELTGEAYFEVAKNKSMPFRVFAKDTEVEVLGTHFNVMAYSDEAELRTTLLEGSVKVIRNEQSETLLPGQQAKVRNKIDVIYPVEDAIAWKKGFVSFEDTGIEEIMRKISRWYDVDVAYKGPKSSRRFTGTIRKNLNLSELLKVLEANDIDFKIDGREITVIQ